MAWRLDYSPRKGYVFTGICHSVHGRGCVSQHALGQTPPRADTPPWQTPPPGKQPTLRADTPSPRRPLQLTMRILLECILV